MGWTPIGIAAQIGVPIPDNVQVFFGDGSDASIRYDGTDLIIDPDLVGSGQIVCNGDLALRTTSAYFGAANASRIFFDTGIVIVPGTGTNAVTIGTATGTSSGDLLINKLGIGGTAISATSYVSAQISGSGRVILDFQLVYTGSSSTGTGILSKFTDQGTGTGAWTNNGVIQQVIIDTATHTGNYTVNFFHGQGALGSNSGFSTGGQVITIAGARLDLLGLGNAGTHTNGTLRTYGIFIANIPTVSGVASHLKMGIWCNGSIDLPVDNEIYFDSTSTAHGDTKIIYVNANTDLEVTVDGNLTFVFDADKNKSEFSLQAKAGTSTTYAKVGGTIDVNTTAVGNVGTGEDDLMTFSIPANSMAVNGDSVRWEMSGNFAANANNKRVRVKYGATTMFDTTALAINNGKWTAWGRIIRTGATTQDYHGEFTTNNALLVTQSFQGTAAETLSGGVTLKSTGEATSNDDVTQEINFVRWDPNE